MSQLRNLYQFMSDCVFSFSVFMLRLHHTKYLQSCNMSFRGYIVWGCNMDLLTHVVYLVFILFVVIFERTERKWKGGSSLL